jgi:hypothetical protein
MALVENVIQHGGDDFFSEKGSLFACSSKDNEAENDSQR